VKLTIQRLETNAFQQLRQIQQYQYSINSNIHSIQSSIHTAFSQKHNKLLVLESQLSANDPKAILQKGYSITKIYDKIITDISQITEGDTLTTQFKNGKVNSIVIKK
jgi:exonuclease VII large subunit